jgi:hypothetical protein
MTNRARALWLTIGTIMVVAGVGYGTLVLVDLLAMHSTTEAIAIDGVESVRRIRVEGSGGSVRLSGTDDATVTGEVRLRSALRSPSHDERIEGDTLVLHSSCPSFVAVVCSANYDLRVPSGMEVTADVSGGSIRVDGLTGPLTLDSSGGGITVRDTSGAMTLDSSGGSITVERSSGPVAAESSGGGVRLLNSTSRNVQLESSGGGITASFAAPPDDVSAESSGGGVTVLLPPGEDDYRVDSRSSGGSEDVEVRTNPSSERRIFVRSSGGSTNVRYADADPQR